MKISVIIILASLQAILKKDWERSVTVNPKGAENPVVSLIFFQAWEYSTLSSGKLKYHGT